MAKIPPHIIDEIMQTSRIEEVIGEFVHLKRSGSNLKGLSPFTDERTPSFMVSPAKQIFKCFSTGKGGTVVSFLMEKEHFSYPEALRWLASKYNITVPEEEPQTAEELAAVTERESLYIINDFARDYFRDQMHQSEEGQAVGLSYFEERGFRKDIIEKFQLGYCPGKGDAFTQAALKKGYRKEYLENVGLIKTKEERSFDFFRGRVMFPIHSISGRVLGFGGRTLVSDKKVAKYFNSPESLIYHKSDILYGLYFAKSDIIKYDNAFLCEGYTDVISMHQAGVANSVASSGTSLTREQIRLIKRYTSNITILYDGDAAGIKASFRGIDLILEEGLNVKVVLFPDGDDPDSYSKKVSSQEFMDFIKSHTQDFLTFKTEMLLKDGEPDPIQRAGLIREVVHSISLIPDQITRTIYTQEVARQFAIDEAVVLTELNKLRKTQLSKEHGEPQISEIPEVTGTTTVPQVQQITTPKPAFSHEEFDLIRILIKYAQIAVEVTHINNDGNKTQVQVSVAELITHELEKDNMFPEYPLFRKIFDQVVIGLKEKNTLYKTSFWLRSEDPEIVNFVSGLESEAHELSPNWLIKYKIDTTREVDQMRQTVMSAVYCFKQARLQDRIEEIRTLLSSADTSDMSGIADLLSEQVVLERVKMTIADQLGRIIF